MKRSVLIFALWASLLGIAHAATFTVSNTNDSGAGSLRQAILSANADASATAATPHQINFTVANGSTITVISPFLVITNHVSINGLGVANLTISGGGTSRIFWIQNGTITIQNLTLANGYAKGGDGNGGGMGAGGAIFMHEGKEGGTGSIHLSLINVNLSNNRAVGGNGTGSRDGGGGMGGNGGAFPVDLGGSTFYYGGAGGVLGNGYAAGGSVTNGGDNIGGTNGGISIFGNGGNRSTDGGPGGFGGGGGGGTTGGAGGFGGGGGSGTGGGSGGFGGGGGRGNIGASGGYGGGGGRGNIGAGASGGFGGGNNGGGGMGAGGAIFVASGSLSLTDVNFTNNNATRGNNGAKGYGGAFFVFNKTDNGGNAAPGTTNEPVVNMCNVTFSGNTADDDNSTYTNNDNVYASNTSSLSPTGYISSNATTICAGGSIQLSFTSPSGTGSFDIVVNGITYNDVPSGSVFLTRTEGTHFTGTTHFNLTQIRDANNCVISGLAQTTTVDVNGVNAGSISGDQTICAAGDPSNFSSTTNGSGAGMISYRWEKSTTNCSSGFSTIADATASTYDPPAPLSQTTYYRRVTISTLNGVACEANSNCVTVAINNVSGGDVAGNQVACRGGDPTPLTSTNLGSGSGTITYRWLSSTVDCFSGLTPIMGATSADYDPPVGITRTTYFRRVTISTLNGVACEAIAPDCIVIVVLNPQGGTIAGDETICSGGDPVAFTSSVAGSSNAGTITYRWESSTTNCSSGFSSIMGATGETYDSPAGLSQTTYFRRVTIATFNGTASGTCEAASNCVTVTVANNTVSGGAVAGDQVACHGGDPITLTSTSLGSGSGTITYRWLSGTADCATGLTPIMGATSADYDPPVGITQTTFFRRTTISTLNGVACEAIAPNCIVIVVLNPQGGTIASGGETLCSGGDPAAFTSSVAGSSNGGTITYRWESSTTNCSSGFSSIMGATEETYNPPAGISQTTYFRRVTITTFNGIASGSCEAVSNCVTVTVASVSAGSISGDQTICAAGDPSNFSSTTNGSGSGTISYRWEKSTTNCSSGFSTIADATASTYDPPAPLSQTTYYRRVTISTLNGVACEAISNCVTVTVGDNQAPTITCPANISVSNDAGQCSAVVTYTAPVGSDNCSGATTTQTAGLASGAAFPVGTTTNTFEVTASNGQKTSCSFTVTVTDAEAPKITCPANISVSNDAGQCSAVVTYTAPVGSDNCSGATTAQTAGLASGAAFPVGVTTNTFEVTAANGQKTSCSFTVTVTDTEAPKITCPANISVSNDAGQCSAVVTYTAPVGSDNCSGATTAQTAGLASGAAFPVGVTTNTFEVTAANGQKTSCSFTVTVTDTEAPKITCPADISVSNDAGQCSAVVTYTAPVGSDNCSGATTTQTAGLASGAAFPVGITTNTFEVTASNGQKTSCSFTVTVTDAEAPKITCPANISVSNDAGQCSAVVTYTAPVGSDNCSGATTAQTAGLASGVAFPVGITTNTFEVTAANGQKTSCSFTVTVTDAEAPKITCPANISVSNDAGQCSAVVTYTAPVGSDNCSGATTTQTAGLASGAAFPVGITTNTFEVTASNGQKTSCSFTVTVTDAEAPKITCPANISVSNDAGQCSAVVTYTAPVGSDNCSGATTTQTAGLASGAAFPVGITTNTFEVTASNGQKTSCSFTVTVTDAEAPKITCPANISVSNDAGQCSAVVTYTAPVGSDNCSGATTTQTAGLASGAAFPVGTTTNTFEVTASNGQKTSCSFTVTVTDAEAPKITCPANISVSNDAGQCSAVVTYTAPVGSDNCSGATTAQIAGLASGAAFPVGTTTNTFEVTASNGQKTSCSFTVTVTDAEAPKITCPANISVSNDAGQCSAVVTYTAPVGSDNCSGATTTQTAGLASGAAFPVGITTNTFEVTASNGQKTSCSFTVTVTDAEAPKITCPANISVSNDAGQCSAVVTYRAPVGSDNCSGATTAQTAGLASGAAFPVGITTNTFEVTAANGQKTSCSFTVTVTDAEAPKITCPANISVSNDAGQCSAVVTYTAPVGSDNCSGATTAQTAGLASGAAFPVGITTNTFEVTAANGQKTSCSFTVTVTDAEAPKITCPANISVSNDAGQCSAVVTYTAPVGSDNCSGATTAQTAGLASGAAFPVGITTNTFEVTAANGQKTSCSFTVTVTDAEAPKITCPANISVSNDAGQCSAVVTYTAPVGSDNCSGATTAQTAGLASGAAFPVGITTNTFEVTAANGQKTSCSFTVTVTDTEAPKITCPANMSVSNDAGQCSAVVTYTAPVGSDNCSGATTAQTAGLASGAAFPVGTTTNTFEVTAANGQKTSCSFTVTVTDAEAPKITCPANISVSNDAGQCSAVVTYTAPVGSDNCSGATTAQTAGLASGAAFPVGTTTNTFEVTASNGQKTSCSFTVTVTDTEAPKITCPANISVSNDAGQCSAVVTYTAPVGSDNCSGATTAQTAGLASGAAFPVGTTTNTFEVTASNGQKTSCSFTVTVTDTEAPKITCPVNISVSNDAGQCSAVVTYTAPVGSDNCSGATTAQIAGLASGAAFPVGTTTNTFEVTASNGQKTSCSFTVTVTDTEAPKITCPANSVVYEGMLVTYVAPVGTDNCAGAVTTQTSGLGTGVLYPVGVTTNTFKVTAANGQTTECSFTVTVISKPTITLTTLQQTLNEGNAQTFCDTDANPVNSLQFTVSSGCVVGTPVWRSQVGSNAWSDWSPNAPVSQSSNNQPHRYQAACDANHSVTYTNPIELTINYRSTVPQNVSLLVDGVSVAVGETKEVCSLVNIPLSFTANCGANEVTIYSVDGGEYSAGVPVGLVDNQYHNYRVRCRQSGGVASCVESESGVMRLKLVVIPSAPTVSLSSTGNCNSGSSFSGQSSCGSLRTVWYNASTNVALSSLPATLPLETTSYYARCQTENGCVSEKSNVVTFTVTPTHVAPAITVSQDIVCTGTTVKISANCPAGSQTFWNTGVTASSFEVSFSNVTKQSYWAKCLFEGGCQSAESIRKDVYWNAFVVTLINIGESKSAIKTNDRSAWTSQFITRDGGPELEHSTQVNPTLYYVENANKMAPRYWTINVEACGLNTEGSLTFDMLATPEMGIIRSFNTHENNAPYFMYANREGWTELYAQNHPAYGFYQDNGAGGNSYDAGLPKGLYKLGIRYWDQKGWGSIYPSTRKPQGNVLAYQEYWFRIQSKDGVGVGAAREGANGSGQEAKSKGQGSDNGKQITDNGAFATVLPNPVTHTLRLKVQDSKGQVVQAALTDAAGREVLSRQFVPETNTHQEEFEVNALPTGMYFLKVSTANQQATLKVVKVE